MTTFSQIIDEMTLELVRPDMINMLPSFLNQAIREVHINSSSNMPVFYDDNRKEAILTVSGLDANADTDVFKWELPFAALYQAMDAVYYDRWNRYAEAQSPQVILDPLFNRPNDRFAYYRSGLSICFTGHGGNGNTIRVAWFEYPRSLIYYKPGPTRPLNYDVESMTYSQPAGAVISLEQAKTLTTNWIVERHAEMLKEGIRAKAYKRMDDQFRASTSYSQWKQLLLGVQRTEQVIPGTRRFK